ncbi:MAG: hypothetical protein DRJ05_07940, partial [Bacteroidetes bacterium]
MCFKTINQIRIVLILVLSVAQLNLYSQNKVDSLLNLLPKVDNKSEIYNLLSEATLDDSLELSLVYARKAFDLSIKENNLN